MQHFFRVKHDEAGSLLTFSKGVAILLVFFHHFARSAWLSRGLPTPALMQWRFAASGEEFGILASAAGAGRYREASMLLMAHFGYVGVHLFVLMSGLGLAFGTQQTVSASAFLKRRVLKLIPPFWLAVAVFSVLDWVAGHPYPKHLIAERLLLLTTFDAKHFFIIDSPLWCLAVFFQLYLLFFPLRRLLARYGLPALLPLAVVGFIARQLAGLPRILEWNECFGHTLALNWLAVFGLGIWIGDKLRRDGEVALRAWTVVAAVPVSMALVILSELSPAAYPMHDTALGVLIGAVAFLAWHSAFDTPVARMLGAVGAISFPLYLYHRPIAAKVVTLWYRRYGTASLPPLGLGLGLAVLLIVLLLLAKRALRDAPRVAAWTLGG